MRSTATEPVTPEDGRGSLKGDGRAGTIPAAAGTSTLGPPRLCEPPEARGLVAPDLLDVLKTWDELSALQQPSITRHRQKPVSMVVAAHGSITPWWTAAGTWCRSSPWNSSF